MRLSFFTYSKGYDMLVEKTMISKLDQKLFAHGMHYELYKKLGAHLVEDESGQGVHFAVWAPNAQSVSVIGDFNGWNENVNIMERQEPEGIYTLYIPYVKKGSCYLYCITTKDGEKFHKADPFGNAAQYRPGKASIVMDMSEIKWTDEKWMNMRKAWNYKEEPVSIYEVHIGSWKRHEEDDDVPYYNYREFAHEVAAHIEEMGYTHIELIGIAEHPFDGSWGYQVTGYYAPTSRYGTPDDFAYMVNYFHEHGIGVILDWVPAHFPKDDHGLVNFDGTPLFEYSDPEKAEHKSWGTKVFDFGKNEVKNFLIANALYWIEQFHIDALRVDAVASMLYLNFGGDSGDWCTYEEENINWEAVEFLKQLNTAVLARNPDVLMIAEESSAWPKVTGNVVEGGLGFNLKWNMGWMHDFIDYMKLNPCFRKGNHYNMTFASTYMYDEDYVLVLSHDEVVHEKKSMLNKMEGPEWEKQANLKVGYAYMMGHPGKKLLFMGQDFAQSREWNENRALDWELLKDKKHQDVHRFYKKLLYLYRTHRAMYEADYDSEGFEWMNADDCDRSVYSFVRYSKDKKSGLLFLCNFAGIAWKDYCISVPENKEYKLVLNSEYEENKIYHAVNNSIVYQLPAYGVAIFEF